MAHQARKKGEGGSFNIPFFLKENSYVSHHRVPGHVNPTFTNELMMAKSAHHQEMYCRRMGEHRTGNSAFWSYDAVVT
jgi:hypothetical protein